MHSFRAPAPVAPPVQPRVPQVPNAPGSVSLGQDSGGGLIVTWTAPAVDSTHDSAVAFNLQHSPAGEGNWTLIAGVNSPYDLTGLPAGTAIDVEVQAVNVAGVGAWSAAGTLATATAVPNAPAAPLLVQGAGSSLVATWLAPAADTTHNTATGYNLRSSPSGAGTWTVVSGVASPYVVAALPAGVAIDVQVQAANAAGGSAWSNSGTLTTAAAGPHAPNPPVISSVTAPADGTNSKLAVTWTASATDSTHDAATGYNLRYGPHGAGTWTTVTGVASPYTITGLAGATAIDVEVQGTNAAASAGAWSAAVTGTSWGATVAPGSWTAATTQVHNSSVAPNGGANMTAAPAPTAVTAASMAWSASATTVPTTGLIAATANGQTNGWGQWFNAPATAGTYYLWLLAQGAGNNTIGALVSSAITVS